MRVILILFLLFRSVASAQPGVPSFCFVLAGEGAAVRPFEREQSVEQHYHERVPYVGFNGTWLKPEVVLMLQGGPLFADTAVHWTIYGPLEDMAESFVLVIAKDDTMRIDLPENVDALRERAYTRWDRATPEVIRFRKGRYAIEELVAAPWSVAAARALAKRLIMEDDAAYKQQLADQAEYYRNLPPPAPPPAPYIQPPPMTHEEWEEEQAKQPGLKELFVDRVHADTIWVRITGRVMLNGGCASSMPLFGLEMPTDSGWVERIPFELIQMDCGMPWADWEDHVVTMPLRWWVAANSREGQRELAPGSYRLFFLGGNGKEMRTPLFTVE